MADTTRQKLNEAFDLIKADRVDDAMAILTPITEAEPDNADAWWLVANAASDARPARRALVNVLRINPAHAKARELLEQLNEMHPPRDDELMMLLEIEDIAPPPPVMPKEASGEDSEALSFDNAEDEAEEDDSFPEFQSVSEPNEIDALFLEEEEEEDDPFGDVGADDDEFALEEDDPFAFLLDKDAPRKARAARSGGGRRRLLRLVALVLIIVLLGALLVLVLGGGDDGGSSSAEADATATMTPAGPQFVTAVDVNADEADNLELVRQSLENDGRDIVGTEVAVRFVQNGQQYGMVLQTCARPSPQVPELVINGMNLLARRIVNTPTIQDDFAMVGVSVTDCDQPADILYEALASMESVLALPINISVNDPAFVSFQQAWIVSQ